MMHKYILWSHHCKLFDSFEKDRLFKRASSSQEPKRILVRSEVALSSDPVLPLINSERLLSLVSTNERREKGMAVVVSMRHC